MRLQKKFGSQVIGSQQITGVTQKDNQTQQNMAQKTDISFIPNLTTMECFKLIGKALWTITKNTGRTINKAVYRYPWFFIVAILIVAFIVSYINITEARVERDKYNKEYTEVETQLEQYKILYDK